MHAVIMLVINAPFGVMALSISLHVKAFRLTMIDENVPKGPPIEDTTIAHTCHDNSDE